MGYLGDFLIWEKQNFQEKNLIFCLWDNAQVFASLLTLVEYSYSLKFCVFLHLELGLSLSYILPF